MRPANASAIPIQIANGMEKRMAIRPDDGRVDLACVYLQLDADFVEQGSSPASSKAADNRIPVHEAR